MATGEEEKQQRLKQKDLVLKVLRMFSEELEQGTVESIWDVQLSSSQIIAKLRQQCSIDYKTEYWLWTQLKRYEEEVSTKLFTKGKAKDGNFTISLAFPYTSFHQKKHLYIAEKLKVANAIYDLLQEMGDHQGKQTPLCLVLGAGGLASHIATILSEHSKEFRFPLEVITHNLGVIEQLGKEQGNLKVSIPGGILDPATYTVLGDDTTFLDEKKCDLIIQGTSFVYKGKLYIESHQEFVRKQYIAKAPCTTRILALSMHECIDDPGLVEHLESYASLEDYDLVIVPRFSRDAALFTPCQRTFSQYLPQLSAEILNWNYAIYRVKKA